MYALKYATQFVIDLNFPHARARIANDMKETWPFLRIKSWSVRGTDCFYLNAETILAITLGTYIYFVINQMQILLE